MASKFYSLVAKDDKGHNYSFSQLQNKVVLIVNVASKCGFTPQYKELEHLYKAHGHQGLVILGFPCNQFGEQEPGTQKEIADFCTLNYGVTFPIMEKIDVNGAKTNPAYEYLKEQIPGALGLKDVKWNFEKFLIDSNGNVVDRYPSTTPPLNIETKIKSLISEIKH
ncbi:Glutathione peroxidase 2 [Smittium mucronatum]|uniref:Glutathione peroxidase n=1 Tax=Smittium mucronatum TaxID=133383 RepID=A0A1R0GVC5_9FUNG|nr:Glutathione peroxidase 2 [Smittium mucronatum]